MGKVEAIEVRTVTRPPVVKLMMVMGQLKALAEPCLVRSTYGVFVIKKKIVFVRRDFWIS